MAASPGFISAAGLVMQFRTAETWKSFIRWSRRHSTLACLAALAAAMTAAGIESLHWPGHDYSGAPWKQPDPGAEINCVRERAPAASDHEIWGFWRGRVIYENDYYQPLTSWLFIAEHHWFGAADRLWMAVSIALHLAVCALLFWTAWIYCRGPRALRLCAGVLAVWIFSGPLLADRVMYAWVLQWWPAQPDILSLLCGLLHLIAVRTYIDRPGRGLFLAALAAFLIGVLFKETAYAAGVAGWLVLARRPQARPLLAALTLLGPTLFLYRAWILGSLTSFGTANNPARVPFALRAELTEWLDRLPLLGLHLLMALPALCLWFFLRRRGASGWTLAAPPLALYLVGGCLLWGPPGDPMFAFSFSLVIQALLILLWIAGLLKGLTRWPGIELLLFAMLAEYLSLSFASTFAWHRYWAHASAALLTGAVVLPGLASLWRAGASRLSRARPDTGSGKAVEASPV